YPEADDSPLHRKCSRCGTRRGRVRPRLENRFRCWSAALATQAQLGDQSGVTLAIGLDQVVKKTTTLRDHLEQAATRVVVFLVGLEVVGQVGDAFRKDRDLNLGRAGVCSRTSVVSNDFALALSRNRLRTSPCWSPVASSENER